METYSAPWLKSYGDVPHNLRYPDCSMVHLVFRAAERYPDVIAHNFFGCKQTYRAFAEEIRATARGLMAVGVTRDDRVTICMPNTPQAVIMFYSLNLIGAVANMVHPLSAPEELVRYISDSRSVAAFTLDQFGDKLIEILPRTDAKTLILCGIEDGLRFIKKPLYKITKGRKITRRPTGGNLLRYKDMLDRGCQYVGEIDANTCGEDVAAILYSGGTSGTTKGILLTNLNFNALAMQTEAASRCVVPSHKMLAIMPIFHGFGLGVCIHTAYITGGSTILVPQFSIQSYAGLLRKHKPHYIAGVPTLFEALLRLADASRPGVARGQGTGDRGQETGVTRGQGTGDRGQETGVTRGQGKIPKIKKLDMSQLEGVFSGGDSLSVELKRKVDAFLLAHGASVQVREGYGLTECVTASCLTPHDFHKEGSIGIPYPDTYYKIVRPGTQETLPYGEEGEITLLGPTVMKGYDNNDEETSLALQAHPDGYTWLHTGDLGVMDEDGFLYFRQRIKRMIVSSGYSIYPSQLENAIESHADVLISCVIGVPDDYKIQRIKAFIVLRDGKEPTDEIRISILDHCRRNIAKYAMPREFEYRKELPRTLVGKVAYLALEEEERVRAGIRD